MDASIGDVVPLLSHVQLFAASWTAAHQTSLSFSISGSLLKLMYIESMVPSNHFILCHCLLLLPFKFPSTRVFSSEIINLHSGGKAQWFDEKKTVSQGSSSFAAPVPVSTAGLCSRVDIHPAVMKLGLVLRLCEGACLTLVDPADVLFLSLFLAERLEKYFFILQPWDFCYKPVVHQLRLITDMYFPHT